MKKIYLSIAVMAVSASSFGQALLQQTPLQTITSAVTRDVVLPVHNSTLTDPTDTLGFDELGAGLTLYGSDGGYIFGTSGFQFPAPNEDVFQFSLEFARGFLVQDPQIVIGAGFVFGAKSNASGSPAAVTAKVYRLDPDRALSAIDAPALDVEGPSTTVLASADIAFADADTVFPEITWVNFDSEASVSADFVIGLDITALYGAPADTLVLLADENGDSEGDFTWTRIVQGGPSPAGAGIWVQTQALFQTPLLVNLAIFAIVAESGVGIEEQGFFNGVKATMFPNPAVSSDNVTIQYGLETAAKNVELSIVNVNGQVVYTSAEGAKASGLYNMNVPAGTLSSGSYIYVLNADGSRIAKRMEILK